MRFNEKLSPNQGKEEDLQEACAKWLSLAYPKAKWFHCPNGGNRNAITGAKLKKQGVKRGVPDFIITSMMLAIELKVGKNTPKPEQIEWLSHFREIGWDAYWVNSFDEFRQCVNKVSAKNIQP